LYELLDDDDDGGVRVSNLINLCSSAKIIRQIIDPKSIYHE